MVAHHIPWRQIIECGRKTPPAQGQDLPTASDMATTVATPLDVPFGMEMFTRSRTDSVFFARPQSTFTDFFDLDGEEDQADEDSPRPSWESVCREQLLSIANYDAMNGLTSSSPCHQRGQNSITSVASYDVATPKSDAHDAFNFHIRRQSSTQGPSGPHLFRYSSDSMHEMQAGLEHALQLSPIDQKLGRSTSKLIGVSVKPSALRL